MPIVSHRLTVKQQFPFAKIDFELVYTYAGKWLQYWFVYDPISGWLLSVGCAGPALAWEVANANAKKVTAKIKKANTASLPD